MNRLGLHARILVGPTRPVPLPPEITRGITSIRIRQSDRRASGCELTFRIGRQSHLGLPAFDHEAAAGQLRQGHRISITANVEVVPVQLFDGIVAEREVSFGDEPGASTLTLRCRDLSLLMELEERDRPYPSQSDADIARSILGEYARHGLEARVTPPSAEDRPAADDTVPEQRSTDLAKLAALADRYRFVFFVQPGATPGRSVAYWGPEPRLGPPRAVLSVDMGSFTNASGFQVTVSENVGLAITGTVRDESTGQPVPVNTSPTSLDPPLAAIPAAATSPELVRTRRLDDADPNPAVTLMRAQARSNSIADGALRATCSVDVARLGKVLLPWQTVEVRGVGEHSGAWYVEEVRHELAPGRYQQHVTLRRGGTGARSPRVTAR